MIKKLLDTIHNNDLEGFKKFIDRYSPNVLVCENVPLIFYLIANKKLDMIKLVIEGDNFIPTVYSPETDTSNEYSEVYHHDANGSNHLVLRHTVATHMIYHNIPIEILDQLLTKYPDLINLQTIPHGFIPYTYALHNEKIEYVKLFRDKYYDKIDKTITTHTNQTIEDLETEFNKKNLIQEIDMSASNEKNSTQKVDKAGFEWERLRDILMEKREEYYNFEYVKEMIEEICEKEKIDISKLSFDEVKNIIDEGLYFLSEYYSPIDFSETVGFDMAFWVGLILVLYIQYPEVAKLYNNGVFDWR